MEPHTASSFCALRPCSIRPSLPCPEWRSNPPKPPEMHYIAPALAGAPTLPPPPPSAGTGGASARSYPRAPSRPLHPHLTARRHGRGGPVCLPKAQVPGDCGCMCAAGGGGGRGGEQLRAPVHRSQPYHPCECWRARSPLQMYLGVWACLCADARPVSCPTMWCARCVNGGCARQPSPCAGVHAPHLARCGACGGGGAVYGGEGALAGRTRWRRVCSNTKAGQGRGGCLSCCIACCCAMWHPEALEQQPCPQLHVPMETPVRPVCCPNTTDRSVPGPPGGHHAVSGRGRQGSAGCEQGHHVQGHLRACTGGSCGRAAVAHQPPRPCMLLHAAMPLLPPALACPCHQAHPPAAAGHGRRGSNSQDEPAGAAAASRYGRWHSSFAFQLHYLPLRPSHNHSVEVVDRRARQ